MEKVPSIGLLTVHKKEKVIAKSVATHTNFLFMVHCKFLLFFATPRGKIWKPLVFTKPDVFPFEKCEDSRGFRDKKEKYSCITVTWGNTQRKTIKRCDCIWTSYEENTWEDISDHFATSESVGVR